MNCQEWHCNEPAVLLVLAKGKKTRRQHQVCSAHFLAVERGEAITLRRDAAHFIGYAAGEVEPL